MLIDELRTRYEKEPHLFDQGVTTPEIVEHCFKTLEDFLVNGSDVDDVLWKTEGDNIGSIVTKSPDGAEWTRIATIGPGTTAMANIRSLLQADLRKVEERANSLRELLHAIDRHEVTH